MPFFLRPSSPSASEAASFLPAIALASVVLLLVIRAQIFSGDNDGSVAVLFAPWSSSPARWKSVAASGGWVLGERWGGLVLDIKSDQPDFAGRLNRHGILAVVLPASFVGCSVRSTSRGAGGQ